MNLIKKNKKLSVLLMGISLFLSAGLMWTPNAVEAVPPECECAENMVMGVCDGPTTRVCKGGLGCQDVCTM